ncbi:MAG: ribonuclease P protein component [Gemmatimonadaceae bacterium]|nr:ribonuclease P protein component [Gemmatimonadaceae bacterium]
MRAADIDNVRREGSRVRTSLVEVRFRASATATPRVAVIVPKYSHSAVERNLVKRRLREIIRLHVLPQLAALELTVRAAPKAYAASFDALRDDAAQWAARLPAA